MKIDMQVEPLVREALHAVVQRDMDKFEEAMRAFPDGPATAKGVEIASAVTLYVVVEGFGGKPTRDQIDFLARNVAEMEAWADLPADDVAAHVASLVGERSPDEALPPETVVVLSFMVAGSLVSSCRRADEKWWDLLDRAEAAAEAVG